MGAYRGPAKLPFPCKSVFWLRFWGGLPCQVTFFVGTSCAYSLPMLKNRLAYRVPIERLWVPIGVRPNSLFHVRESVFYEIVLPIACLCSKPDVPIECL